MTEDEIVLEHVFINFSRRNVILLDEEGYESEINYKFDEEGSEGFSETISMIQNQVPHFGLTLQIEQKWKS